MSNKVKKLFGYNLKRLRKDKGISQMELAEIVGMTFNFISDIETGKKWVSPESIEKFSESLNVPVYYFFLPIDQIEIKSNDVQLLLADITNMFEEIKEKYK